MNSAAIPMIDEVSSEECPNRRSTSTSPHYERSQSQLDRWTLSWI